MRPLSALIRTANAISGQITSFRLVMTELWTLTEVITGKSGCGKKKKKEKKREKKGKGQQGWEGMEEEEDRGWWNWVAVNFNLESKMGFFSCLQSCSSPKLTAMPDIQTSRCDPDRGVGLEGGLAPSVNFFLKSLQTSVIHFRPHTQKKKKTSCKRSGGAAALYDSDRDECVIVVEVTGADSTSVQFEMRRWTDRRRGAKKTHASSLIGVRIWKEAGQ